MLRGRKYWNVFVAHPNDVKRDAEAVNTTINQINELFSESTPLKFLSGRTHAVPGVGKESIEDRIIPIMEKADIFVGIMWRKFGETITLKGKDYESATEAEFEYFLDRIDTGDNVAIMFYFCDKHPKDDEADLKQYESVTSFHNSLKGKKAYYGTYTTRSQFKDKLIRDLRRTVEELEVNEKANMEGMENREETGVQNSTLCELLYEHDENGKRLNGDINHLINAVTEGRAIRIRVHHPNGTIQVMDVPLLSVENGVVHASDIYQISKARDKIGNYVYQEKSYRYLVITNSNGFFHAKRIFFDGTDRNATTSKRHIAWIGSISPKI